MKVVVYSIHDNKDKTSTLMTLFPVERIGVVDYKSISGKSLSDNLYFQVKVLVLCYI